MNQVQLRIAVVDDEPSVRKAIARRLSASGMVVETFSSGACFIEAIQNYTLDCVVLDLHMPLMSGFDVLARLAECGFHIPAVVLTGNDSPESQERALTGGASAYLLKPVDGKTLIKAIAAAILSASTNRLGDYTGWPKTAPDITVVSHPEPMAPSGFASIVKAQDRIT